MSDQPKIGRPTKYKPEYCELLIEHMSRGMTYTSFAGHPRVRVNIDTLYQWEKDYPAFSEAKSVARQSNEYFFMDTALKYLDKKKDFNTTMWYMMMKNIHGWRDKQEAEVSHQIKAFEIVEYDEED